MILFVALAIIMLSPFIADILWQLGTMSIRKHNNQPTEVWVKDVEFVEND